MLYVKSIFIFIARGVQLDNRVNPPAQSLRICMHVLNPPVPMWHINYSPPWQENFKYIIINCLGLFQLKVTYNRLRFMCQSHIGEYDFPISIILTLPHPNLLSSLSSPMLDTLVARWHRVLTMFA